MKTKSILSTVLLAAATMTLGAGCQSNSALARVTNKITTPDGGQTFVVATEKTAFYRYGPQQGSGPDMELPKDTLVNLIRNSFGYSKVKIAESGQQGFVSSEDIMRASPTLIASLTKPPEHLDHLETTTSSSSEVENFDVRSTDPNYVPPPEELPPPDLPPESGELSPQ